MRKIAEKKGIIIEHHPSLWHRLNGSGTTVTIGESGATYKGGPVSEPISKIIYWGESRSTKIHELTHVEQRLRDPTWENTTLEEMEIEASKRALEATRAWDYPLSSLNQLINLGVYTLKLKYRQLKDAISTPPPKRQPQP